MNLISRIEALPPDRRRAFIDVLKHDGARYDVHPLTGAQLRMWLLSQLRPDSAVYNVAYRFDISGDLDGAALEAALQTVTDRHEALRTVFVPLDGEPRQMVLPAHARTPRLQTRDLTEQGIGSPAERLEELAAVEARRPFDLAEGPLIRATLARTGEHDWVLLLTLHHIVCDGWSMRILYDDLARAYAAHRDGTPPILTAIPRYVDAARRQEESLDAATRERLYAHWRDALAGAPTSLDLLTDRPRPAVLDDAGGQLSFSWPAELAQQLAAVAQARNLTPFVVLLAACHALLYRHTHQTDILVGAPAAGRALLETEGVVGLFVNTLVLRARLAADMTFAELLDQVRDTAVTAVTHQELPFDLLVERLGADRELSAQPLFQVMLAVEDGEAERLDLADVTVRCAENHTGTAKFDLTFVLLPFEDRVDGRLEYRTQLFDRATIRRLADHLRRLLSGALADLDRPIADLPLLSVDEHAELRRAAGSDWPRVGGPRSLHALVEAVTDGAPDAPAVTDERCTVTYRQLDERANRIAAFLRDRGVGPESPVGVCLPSCPDLVAAFLGALKAGAMYVPLDPGLPAERLRYLVEDAGVDLVLCRAQTMARLPSLPVPVVALDGDDPTAAYSADRASAAVQPGGAAYLVYTSGSTGRPKGVVGTHRGLRNLAEAQRDLLQVRPADRVLQFHSIGFDVSVSELVTALSAGAELRLVPPERRQPGPELAEAIRGQGVTVADLPPVALGAMEPDELPGLRSLTVGGEPCPTGVAIAWAHGREFYNAYGPTETTVTATAARYMGGVTVPIGRPVTGARAYVLDARLAPVPIGIAGELYVGGAGLARGYLGDAALTAQRFMPDPFAGGEGARMYRTGDVVRWLPDGSLEFLGRADSQVKIRGHRIELGEVETRLRACPGVRRAGVAVRQDRPGEPRLVGYVVGAAAGEGAIEGVRVDSLRRELQRHLPGYMVPEAFVFIDDLPMTPSGKLDVRALPAPDTVRPVLDTAYVSPRAGFEAAVAAVWQEVLGLGQVGSHDNFFDLGGNSLLIAKARARLAESLGTEIPTVELFRHPTVASLARHLSASDHTMGSVTPTSAARGRANGRDQQAAARRRALAERGRRLRTRQEEVGQG